MPASPPQRNNPTWLRPHTEEQGLKQYLETIRERLWLVLVAVAVTTAVAIAYVATAEKVYEAEADVLVTPVPSDSDLLVSLGLLRDSSDPLRVVETASRLITTPDVAELASEKTGLSEDDPERLLADVSAEPVAESNLVGIIAQASTAEEAADLANAFGEAVIQRRTAELGRRIEAELEQLEGETDAALEGDVAALQRLAAGPVPDMKLETRATPPGAPIAPRPLLSVLAGIIAGLVIGIGAAFLIRVLDPRFRREEQLRSRFNLPVLARIPKQSSSDGKPLTPDLLSGEAIEALRTLRASLSVPAARRRAPAALITSASAADGKTTTAFNLAAVLALSGSEVILIEADLRLPRIAAMVGSQPESGVVSTLIEETSLDQALTISPAFGSNLKLLLAEHSGPWLAELFSLPSTERMIDEARSKADYVIIDSPPLTEVVDALPLARAVDDVVLTLRLGTSRLDKITALAELLAENQIEPAGFVVVGSKSGGAGSYYHDYASQTRMPGAGPRPGETNDHPDEPDRIELEERGTVGSDSRV